jgi:hypothetical protein
MRIRKAIIDQGELLKGSSRWINLHQCKSRKGDTEVEIGAGQINFLASAYLNIEDREGVKWKNHRSGLDISRFP